MKAQSFFGGTNPKETGKGAKQFGHKGTVQNRTGSIAPKVTVKQVNHNPTTTTYERKTANRQVGHKGRHA